MSLDVVILAAGQGTRMYSTLPKVLQPLAGRPMLAHVLDSARQLDAQGIFVVVGVGAEQVKERLGANDLQFVLQQQQLGTGHALAQAVAALSADKVLVLYGDVPLLQAETLQRLLAAVNDRQVALLTVALDDPKGYGRIQRDGQGQIQGIVEHKDANAEQLAIKECNTGILALPRAPLADWLGRLGNDNSQGEYYLTDIIALAVADRYRVVSEQPNDPLEVLGANDHLQLAQLERHYQRQAARQLLAQGVTLLDPERFDLRGQVQVGRNVVIDINVILEGQVVIEDGVHIGPHSIIKDSILRRGTEVKAFCHLDGVELAEGADCGPYARLRPGSLLGPGAHVGNFVEVKNAQLGAGVKAGHLSYLGDASIGARTNIGAGTITCNYDGANKHRTELGEDVFIGSNTALVAPVRLGDGATTAAGSTINKDIPAGALAVARAKARVIDGWQRPVKTPKQ